MTGMKDQYFGVEVEMTGITREQAAQALADYFGTVPLHRGGVYDAWIVKDTENKEVRKDFLHDFRLLCAVSAPFHLLSVTL